MENVAREVKRELSVRVKDCSSLLKQDGKVIVSAPRKVPGIHRTKTKTPRSAGLRTPLLRSSTRRIPLAAPGTTTGSGTLPLLRRSPTAKKEWQT